MKSALTPPSPYRILLVEFVNADQFPGLTEDAFPFFKAFLNHHGAPNAWLRYAIAADNLYRNKRDEVTLQEAEFKRLSAAAVRIRANVVFSTLPLFSGQLRRLRERFPGLRAATWSRSAPLILEVMRRLEPGRGFEGFNIEDILARPEMPLDFRWEKGNDAGARADRNNVYIFAGTNCAYAKPVRSNPLYAGVKLAGSVTDIGCAFCGGSPARSAFPEKTVRGWITRQIRGIERTLGPDRLPGAVILENMRNVSLLEHTLDALRRSKLPRTALLVGVRLDHLLKFRPALEKLLKKLRGSRQSIHCNTIGSENFSDAELLRFNKGFDFLTALKGINLLKEMEAAHIGAFHYSGYKSLSTILFTPWTKLADLQHNLRMIQHFELENEMGNLLSSRLRLHEDLAITSLAAKDGLLADSEAGGTRMNRLKLLRREKGWRFQDPRLDPLCRISLRLEREGAFAGDPLYQSIQAGIGAMRDPRRLVSILLRAVETVETTGKVSGAKKLFQKALALSDGKRRSALPEQKTRAGCRLGGELTAPARYLDRVLPLLEKGEKPLLSLEGLAPRDLAALDLKGFKRRGFFFGSTGRGDSRILYVSRDLKVLKRILKIAPRLSTRGSWAQAAHREAGRLFGYPRCCVRAWLANDWRRSGLSGWPLLDWRLAQKNPLSPALNPLLAPDISFLPCSAGCGKAEKLYRRWFAALGAPFKDRSFQKRVFLFSLMRREELASFIPLERRQRTLIYDPRSVAGVDGELKAVLVQGDRIVTRPAHVEVLRGARLIKRWVAETAVWDHRGGMDREVWRELAKAAWRRQDPRWRRLSELAAKKSILLSVDSAANSESRLLLIEFVSASPQRNESASFFPFYSGFAQGEELRTQWLCVGVRSGAGSSLPKTEIAELAEGISKFSPTHIIANERFDKRLETRIKKEFPNTKFLFTAEDDPPTRSPTRFYQTGWLSEWLGLPVRGERFFVGTVKPIYDAVMMNRRAREVRPLLTVVGGVNCEYSAALGRNPYFRGVDLSRCVRRHGCSFCSSVHPPASSMKVDPLRLARDQFSAMIRAGARGGRVCGRFEICDIRLFKKIPGFLRMILKLKLPPSEFFFAPRVDDLLKVGADLEALLPRLAARGHKVSLFRMGLEHFSPSENERFNKGVDPKTVDRGLALARRLQRAHPGGFSYAAPLGYIAFTPWTTLKDLELSLQNGIRRSFSPQAPWLYSMLELREGTPITALARHEGDILRERFDDVAMTYSVQVDNRDQTGLLPWRFKDRRTAEACRIIVRVCAASLRGTMPDDAFRRDPLYAWLKRFLAEGRLDTKRPDLFALELLAVLKAGAPPWDPKKLVRETFARLKTGFSARLPASDSRASTEALKLDLDLAVAELLGLHSRTKDILAAPPVAPGMEAVAGILRRLGADRSSEADPLSRKAGTFFREASAAGFSRGYLAHLAVSVYQQTAWSGRRVLPAGILSGVSRMIPRKARARPIEPSTKRQDPPECCSKASLEITPPFKDAFFWSSVASRIAASGEVPWEMNPDNPALKHLPCSLGCLPTLQGLREDLRARQKKARASGKNIIESLKQPFLLIWGFDKAMVELMPEDEPSERFKYRAESSSPPCPDVAGVLQGDELLLDEDKVIILKKGRIFSSLSGRSFLWWHKKSFQTAFWRSLIERRETLANAHSKVTGKAARALNKFLSCLDSEFKKKHRIPCRSRHDGELLMVTLSGKTWPLFLVPKTAACKAYYETTPNYYVGIRGKVEMSESEQNRLRAYLGMLGRRDNALRSCLSSWIFSASRTLSGGQGPRH